MCTVRDAVLPSQVPPSTSSRTRLTACLVTTLSAFYWRFVYRRARSFGSQDISVFNHLLSAKSQDTQRFNAAQLLPSPFKKIYRMCRRCWRLLVGSFEAKHSEGLGGWWWDALVARARALHSVWKRSTDKHPMDLDQKMIRGWANIVHKIELEPDPGGQGTSKGARLLACMPLQVVGLH